MERAKASYDYIKNKSISATNAAVQGGREGIAAVMTNPKYFGIAMAVELLLIWLILYKWSPFGIGEKYPGIVTSVMILNAFINVSMYLLVDGKWNYAQGDELYEVELRDIFSKVGFTALSILAVVFAIWGIVVICEHPLILSWLSWIFNFFFVSLNGLIITSLAYLFLKPYIDAGQKQGAKSVFTLLGSFIMYLPCALIDLIDWVKYQYSITTSTTMILLGIEAGVLALGFILPKVVSWILTRNGNHLLRYPIYLDKQTIIGKYEDLYDNKDNSSTHKIGNFIEITNESPKTKNGKYHYRYSISAWFWLNPQPPNTRQSYTKYTNILEYGNKPVVEYNGLENSLRVRCQLENDNYATIFETDEVNFQTWNNIVINYDGGNMDVFLNGELVGSRPNISPYMSYENIVVGEDKGLEGGIANVIYYDKILQKSEILMGYKSLKNLPSPVL